MLPPLRILIDLDREDGFDAKHGTDTWSSDDTALVAGGRREHFAHFPTLPRMFHTIMRQIDVDHSEYVFVDIGAGKGRGLLLASDYPFQRGIGVELAADVTAVAAKNLQTYRSPSQRCTDLRIVCGDATELALPDGNLFVHIFNPFDIPEPMAGVLANLRAAVEAKPRKVVVVYTRPIFYRLVDECGFLHRWGTQGIDPLPPQEAAQATAEGRYAYGVWSNF